MHRPGILAVLFVVSLPPLVHAQSLDLSPGERVRFKIEGTRGYQTGTVRTAGDGSLILSTADGTRAIPMDGTFRVQRWAGKEDHPGAGLLIGAAVGAVFGLVVAASEDYSRQPRSLVDLDAWSGSAMEENDDMGFALMGAGVGAVAGLLVGTILETDAWTDVSQPWSVGVSGTPTGATVALTIPLSASLD
jgi:hypothetical protein